MNALVAMREIAAIGLHPARRRRLLAIGTVLLLLVALAVGIARLSGDGGVALFRETVDVLLRFVIPLLMLMLAGGGVSDEVRAKTITYLLCRPIPRFTLPLGKYVAGLSLAFALMLPAVLLIYAAALIGHRDGALFAIMHLLRALFATALACMLYGAIATAFGAIGARATSVAAAAYLLVVEVGMSYVPGKIKAFSMATHLRELAGTYVPKTTAMFLQDPQLTPTIASACVLFELCAWLALALLIASTSEYRTEQ